MDGIRIGRFHDGKFAESNLITVGSPIGVREMVLSSFD